MKIAKRMSSLHPEGAFSVLAKANALEREGKNIIHLEIGQPDFLTPKHIAQAGRDAIKAGRSKYTPSLGIIPLREALAEYYRKITHVAITYHQVGVTPGCKHAIFAAFAAIIDPGDEVIYPNPGFPAYESLISFFGGIPVPVPLREKKEFSFDMEILKKNITKRTKAILLNSPGNPTGTIIPKKDLEAIAALAKKENLWVISDEIYNEILYTDEKYFSIYSIPGMKERTIIVNGFSKTYAMTGWRFGYLIFPEQLESTIELFLTNSISCTATFIQDAALSALNSSQSAVLKMVAEYRKRRDLVVKQLNEIDGVVCFKPSGAFYAFPNVKSFKKPSKEIAQFILQEAGVALLAGTAFGKYGEGYLRISYATDKRTLEEGISRIKTAFTKL